LLPFVRYTACLRDYLLPSIPTLGPLARAAVVASIVDNAGLLDRESVGFGEHLSTTRFVPNRRGDLKRPNEL
jgi:hypothetical protein